jgi:hypothetical protein
LNVKTFKEHKRLFFSEESSTWIVAETRDSDTDSSVISIEPGDSEMEEGLHDNMMNHEQFSSSDMDMDVFPETSDKAPQPSARSSSDCDPSLSISPTWVSPIYYVHDTCS